MLWGTPISGDLTALQGLHVIGEYRDKSMQHTCSRHVAWDLLRGSYLLNLCSVPSVLALSLLFFFVCTGVPRS